MFIIEFFMDRNIDIFPHMFCLQEIGYIEIKLISNIVYKILL